MNVHTIVPGLKGKYIFAIGPARLFICRNPAANNGSDSGIDLQGRCAVQLADSGCTKNLTAAETGLDDQRLRDKILLPEISTEHTAIATTISMPGLGYGSVILNIQCLESCLHGVFIFVIQAMFSLPI